MKKLVFLVLLLVGCCSNVERREEKKEFVRIFMHNPGYYSVMVKDDGELKIFYDWGCKQKVICDISSGEPMYYKIIWKGNSKELIEYHIHSAKDIDGGTSGGKNSIKTNVVE